jgi:hypothetical protein
MVLVFIGVFFFALLGISFRLEAQKGKVKKNFDSKKRVMPHKQSTVLVFLSIGGLLALFIGYFTIVFGYNPSEWGYGMASNFHHAVDFGDKILLHDAMHVSGKSRSSSYTRLHILDAKTGKRLYRGMVGEKAELASFGDTLWYFGKGNMTIFDLPAQKIITKLNEADLKKVPELSKGIQFDSYTGTFKPFRRGNEIVVNTLDGYQYSFNPFIRKARPYKRESLPKSNQSKTAPQKITVTIDNGDGKKPLPTPKQDLPALPTYQLQNSEINPLRQTIVDNIRKPINPQLTFLHPQILHTEYTHQVFIVKHFETSQYKQSDFILSAVDFTGKVLWEKRLKDFDCYDYYSFWQRYDFHRSIINGKHLILTFGGFVYALDLKNGQKVWENRL